jgi:hypothetical protein
MDAVLVIADDEADPLDQNWIIDTIIEGRGHADALDVPLLVDLREAQLTGTRDIHAWSCDLVRLSAGDTVSHVRWPGEPRAEPFAEGAPLRPPQSRAADARPGVPGRRQMCEDGARAGRQG